jgi:hypothetical protein
VTTAHACNTHQRFGGVGHLRHFEHTETLRMRDHHAHADAQHALAQSSVEIDLLPIAVRTPTMPCNTDIQRAHDVPCAANADKCSCSGTPRSALASNLRTCVKRDEPRSHAPTASRSPTDAPRCSNNSHRRTLSLSTARCSGVRARRVGAWKLTSAPCTDSSMHSASVHDGRAACVARV